MLHIPTTNLGLLADKQESYKKAYLLTKNTEEFFGGKKKTGEWDGTAKQQEDRPTTFKEAQTIIKVRQRSKCLQQYPRHDKYHLYHLLSRSANRWLSSRCAQAKTAWTTTSFFTEFRTSQSELCDFQTCNVTTKPLQQKCPLRDKIRCRLSPVETSVAWTTCIVRQPLCRERGFPSEGSTRWRRRRQMPGKSGNAARNGWGMCYSYHPTHL